MIESFALGMSTAFLVRTGALKIMKWPLTSRPNRLLPEMLWGGFLLSLLDVSRRVALQNALNKEQATEVAEMMRKSQQHYKLAE